MKKDDLDYEDLLKEYMRDSKYNLNFVKHFWKRDYVFMAICRFAHGKEELFQKSISHRKYKVKKCVYYYQNSFCSYGSRCHFKLDDRKLNQTFRSYYSYLLNLVDLNIHQTETEEMTYFDENETTLIDFCNRPISPC